MIESLRVRGIGAGRLLIAVAIGFAVVQLIVVRHVGLSFDETVYLSQVNPRVPTLFFSAPRARGITLIVAPLVFWTSWDVALRVYLAVVSAIGLVVAYWPWLRVARDQALVPLAALLLAGLWVVQYYGSAAMPNLYVAYGAVAAVGWFVRYATGQERRALVGMAVSLAVVALMRPGDAFWLAVPLVVLVFVKSEWRRVEPLAAMVTGLVIGGAEWVIEAYTSYGGLLARLHRSSEIQGGLDWHPESVAMELHALNGPMLCRPCTPGVYSIWLSLWWLAIPFLVAAGIAIAVRRGRAAEAVVPTVCGIGVAIPYLVMVGYAAPRFLIPTYALLALPTAALLVGLPASITSERWRKGVAVALSLGLVLHLTAQHVVLQRRADRSKAGSYDTVAARLKELGVHPPCTLSGHDAFPIAYRLRCSGEQTTGHNESITVAGLLARAKTQTTAVLTRTGRVPSYARTWRPHHLTHGRHGWTAYLSP